MKYIVAKVCIDSDGRYSLSTPQPNQGGDIGFGSLTVGEGELDKTIDMLKGILRNYHDYHLAKIGNKGVGK
jgi:hypothetical protein